MGHHLVDLYRYRSLIATLVLREMRARYRGSLLGFLWSFLNPLFLMGVYLLVFSVYLRVQMPNYAVFLFTGLLPWLWFSSSLGHATGVIVGGGGLVKRVLFPAEILPIVSVFSNLINLILSLPLLFFFLFLFSIPLRPVVLWLPLLVAVQLCFTVGLALALSALNVHLRDVEQILANLLVLWFFLSPILYPVSQVPARFRFLYFLNPMAGLIQGYQNILFHGTSPHWIYLGFVAAVALVTLWVGYGVFDRLRDTLAEEV